MNLKGSLGLNLEKEHKVIPIRNFMLHPD